MGPEAFRERRRELRLRHEELLAGFPAGIQPALSHPMRREILRVLNDGAGPQTPRELCAAVAGGESQLSRVGYHVAVLETAKIVRRVDHRLENVEREDDQDGRRLTRLFVSAVADDKRVEAVLEATKRSDRS